jgi:two-component system OmpR family sensor kinase/two-component system sensor histidine kinase QseC
MSLRRTTLLTLAILLSIVGIVAGLASYSIAGREANEFLDLQLRQVAGFAAQLEADVAERGPLPPHDEEDDFIVEIRFSNQRAQVCLPAPCRFPDAPQPGFSTVRAGGHDWRAFALILPDRTVQVGQQQEVRREMASGAALAALLPLLLVIPVVWLVVDAVLRRAFRRLALVTGGIAARDAADTTAIPFDHVPLEIRPLVVAMNGLLARLRGLMDQQRAFVADAAHQLRTPLAALTLEVGNLRMDAGGADPRLSFVEAAVHRASALVAQLLRLARQEAGSARRAPVPLRPVVAETIGALAPMAIARDIDLGLVSDLDATVLGDHDDFRALLEIVMENALRYTPAGGTVDVEMRATPEGPQVCVRDTGPGIPPEALPRVFERFFRVEGQEPEGSGLGLAIADLIARRHGVALSLRNREDQRGLEATLTFPGARAEARG